MAVRLAATSNFERLLAEKYKGANAISSLSMCPISCAN
ncbi:hypothetical protein WFA24289_00447 [Periweissella fabaria]|uniref:Uncharacterized protein n=1 Tax=Periweissella fabaria TaxID=546157 RepID=A0ABM8Z496_9LACO|nr:hypothetical protein WFA24289_00447 [Periweissella fabaria]